MGVLIYNHRKGNNVIKKTRAVTPKLMCYTEREIKMATTTNTIINIHELIENNADVREIARAISGHYSDFSADPITVDDASEALYEALQGADAIASRHAEKVALPEVGLAQRVIDLALQRDDESLLDLLDRGDVEALRDAIDFWAVIGLQEEAVEEAKASIDDKSLISELEEHASWDGDLEATSAFRYAFWTGAANLLRASR